jgi:hypothetical protein
VPPTDPLAAAARLNAKTGQASTHVRRKRKALVMMLTDDNAMAVAGTTGDTFERVGRK